MISGLTIWNWTTTWHALSWGRLLLLYSWVLGKGTKILHEFALDIYNFSRIEKDLWLPNTVDCLFFHSLVSEAGFHAVAWGGLEPFIQPRMLHTMTVLVSGFQILKVQICTTAQEIFHNNINIFPDLICGISSVWFFGKNIGSSVSNLVNLRKRGLRQLF